MTSRASLALLGLTYFIVVGIGKSTWLLKSTPHFRFTFPHSKENKKCSIVLLVKYGLLL